MDNIAALQPKVPGHRVDALHSGKLLELDLVTRFEHVDPLKNEEVTCDHYLFISIHEVNPVKVYGLRLLIHQKNSKRNKTILFYGNDSIVSSLAETS